MVTPWWALSQATKNKQLEQRHEAVAAVLKALQIAKDPQIELVLSKSCMGTCKINHMLRARPRTRLRSGATTCSTDEVPHHNVEAEVAAFDALWEQGRRE